MTRTLEGVRRTQGDAMATLTAAELQRLGFRPTDPADAPTRLSQLRVAPPQP